MAILSKKYVVTHPLTPEQAAHIEEMFGDIYRQLRLSAVGSGVLGVANGGTGSSLITFTGPLSARTFTLPDANAIILTDAATVTVPQGGTTKTSFTAYAVLCGGTAATSALQNVSGVGTAAQVLTSNGAATLPTWQALPAGQTWARSFLLMGA